VKEAAAALAGCTAPPGRMEVIESTAQGKPKAVIDYAHTPDALAKALGALREHCRDSFGACSAAEATGIRQTADDGHGGR